MPHVQEAILPKAADASVRIATCGTYFRVVMTGGSGTALAFPNHGACVPQRRTLNRGLRHEPVEQTLLDDPRSPPRGSLHARERPLRRGGDLRGDAVPRRRRAATPRSCRLPGGSG